MYCIGVDLGGTSVKLGLFDSDGNLVDKAETPTRAERGCEEVFREIANAVESISKKHSLMRTEIEVGVGIPGPIDENGYVEALVNLNMYDVYPEQILTDMLGGVRVVAANDANVAALGELWQGAGKGCKSLFLVTLGTGVGGGVVINGKPLQGVLGMAGEIGHIMVNPDEPEVCSCGGIGHLDQMASARGIVRNAKRFLAADNRASIMRNVQELSAKDVFDAAKSGDSIAEATIDYCMSFLGRTLASVSYILDPDVILIGGGVAKAGEYLLNVVNDHFVRYPKLRKQLTPIRLAQLGNDAGMYGAARLVLP